MTKPPAPAVRLPAEEARAWLVSHLGLAAPTYPSGVRSRPVRAPDERLRILGPLDPLLWDRTLVQHAFGFEYVWEVYKPAAQRRWGWYVCPLLHRGQLVGRLEARVEEGVLRVEKVSILPTCPAPLRAQGARKKAE